MIDKAKAYDEALERARKQRDDYQKELDKTDKNSQLANILRGGISAIELAFPELTESEDEKIRQAIIKSIEEDSSIYEQEVSKEQMLAYLEKQKDQKPTHTAKEMWKEMRLEVYAQASGNRHEPNCSDDSTKMFSLCDIDEIFEKIGNTAVGSQPTEWSEEDKKDIAHIIQILDDCYAFGRHDLSKTDHENLVNKLKSLHPIKQEWTKEDEEIIYSLRSFLILAEQSGRYDSIQIAQIERCLNWLKSLRPQPKAELTLLDKNIIKAAVAFVEQNNHFNCWGGIDKHTVIKALRSLKPHWKPSEEQMKALNALNCHGDLSYIGQQDQLISLYNDLKKLI